MTTKNTKITPKKITKKPEKNSEQIANANSIKKGDQMNRIRFQFDITYKGTRGTQNKGESNTIPDLNLSVRQLLENHSRGSGSNVEVRKPLYLEFDIPTLKDITDVDVYREKVEQQLDQIKAFQKSAQNQADHIDADKIKRQEIKDQEDRDFKAFKDLQKKEEKN